MAAADQFSRTVTNGWGSAGTGGAYTLVGTSSNFSVNGTTGRMAVPSAGVSRSVLLASVNVQDVDLTARVQTDKLAAGSSMYAFFVARRVSAGNEYFGRVELKPGGAIRLSAARVVAGAEALLGTEATATGLTHQANTALQVRLQVTGHTGEHTPVAGATVTGVWTGGAEGSATCTTNSDGECNVTSGNLSQVSASATWTVEQVTHSTLSYEFTGNHDPDGDSTGTSITLLKP